MDPAQQQLFAQSLALCALFAGTLQYAILMRHRAERRLAVQQEIEVAQSGLLGLVRVMLVDRQ